MSDEKKISDDELVEIAGGGVVIELGEGGVALEPQQDIIGIKPIEEEEGGSLDRD